MGKIAHLEMTCKNCGKTTNVFVEESNASSTTVKCEHCKKTFEFGPGMLYNPIGYVSEIPQWARMSGESDKTKKPKIKKKLNPYACMVCNKPLEFAMGMIPAFMQDSIGYHCRDCKNSICYTCAHTKKCVVCGGIHFDASFGKPPLAD